MAYDKVEVLGMGNGLISGYLLILNQRLLKTFPFLGEKQRGLGLYNLSYLLASYLSLLLAHL